MTWVKNHNLNGKPGVLIFLYVQPGASKTKIQGLYQDRLKLSVQSPPVDGAANEAVIDFLKKLCRRPKSKIHLIAGETSRLKTIWIQGATLDELKCVLETAMLKK